MKANKSKKQAKQIASVQAEVLDLSLKLQFLGRTMDEMPYGRNDLEVAIPAITTIVRESGARLAKLSEDLDVVNLNKL